MSEFDNQELTYERVYTSVVGGIVWVHLLHGKEELAANLVVSRFLADLGENIWLLPTSTEPSVENPDARINNEVWEFKTNNTGTKNSVENGIKRVSKQADNVLLHLLQPMLIADLENAIHDRVRQCPTLRKLRIIYQEQLYEFTRRDITSQVFRGAIKKEKGA